MAAYKALIFDLGKVIFDLSFDRVFQFWANASGNNFDTIKNKFEFDELFEQFERNTIRAADFRAVISQRLGLELMNADFDKGWCDLYLDVYEGIDHMLTKLKNNYRLVALTNTNIIHNNTWRSKYAGTLKHFEQIYSSHEMGTRKPEKQAYETVLNYLQCNPAEAIFLDDNPDNTDGAKKLGIATILVTSTEQMKNDLRKYNIRW